MRKNLKNLIGVLFISFCLLAIFNQQVYADSGTGGNDTYTGSCGSSPYCHTGVINAGGGLQWLHYSFTNPASNEILFAPGHITFEWRGNTNRSRIFDVDRNTNCRSSGGFWVLVSLEHANGVLWPNGNPGRAVRMRDIAKNKWGFRTDVTMNPDSTGDAVLDDWTGDLSKIQGLYQQVYLATGKPLDQFFCGPKLQDEIPKRPTSVTENPSVVNCYGLTTYTRNYGDTAVRSRVRNFNNGQDRNTVSNGNNTRVYAKPGDNIQFNHTFCAGSLAVKGGTNGNRTNNGLSQTFRLNSYLNGSLNNNYRFGAGNTTLNESKLSTEIASPNNNNYSCPIFGIGARSKAYQIPGIKLENSLCKPSVTPNKTSVSDVGKSISQTISYENRVSWVTTRNNGHNNGECGCANKAQNFGPAANFTGLSFAQQKNGSPGNQAGLYVARCLPANPALFCPVSGQPSYIYGNNHIDFNSIRRDGINNFNAAKTASAIIPYNFNTTVSSKIVNPDVIYAGESVTGQGKVVIKPRKNIDVAGNNAYATITPANSKIRMIGFTISPDRNPNGLTGGLRADTGANPQSLCNYYRDKVGARYFTGCNANVVAEDGALNTNGSYNGATIDRESSKFTVPDTAVGQKFCIAMAVWPADSHDLPNQDAIASGQNGTGAGGRGLDGGTGKSWRISNASCRTIAKKPNFQAWGAIYSNGGISTSLSKKMVGASFNANFSPNAVFGSFSEFESIANNGFIYGLSSGAGLGYETSPTMGVTAKAGYRKNGKKDGTSYCEIAELTIANSDCNAGKGGKSNITVSQNNLTRLYNRYTMANNATGVVKQSGIVTVPNLNEACPATAHPSYQCLPSGAKYIEVSGDAYLPAINIPQGSIYQNNTLIIYARGGSINISGNIQHDDNVNYQNIAQIYQVLLIADNGIKIDQDVTKVDAWLIARNGDINTCSQFKEGESGTNVCNKQLVVNGPAIAKKFLLRRTAGALPGNGINNGAYYNIANLDLSNDGSITPGEIFNLRSDAYFWAYNQAQRSTQAIVTYTRELAPRY